jgi:hypothetical protein
MQHHFELGDRESVIGWDCKTILSSDEKLVASVGKRAIKTQEA